LFLPQSSLFSLFLSLLGGFINLILVCHEYLQQNDVGSEDTNCQHDPVDTDDVFLQFEVDHTLDQQYCRRHIRRVVKEIANADEARDDKIHLDILELTRVKIVLPTHLVHGHGSREHDNAGHNLTSDAATAKD